MSPEAVKYHARHLRVPGHPFLKENESPSKTLNAASQSAEPNCQSKKGDIIQKTEKLVNPAQYFALINDVDSNLWRKSNRNDHCVSATQSIFRELTIIHATKIGSNPHTWHDWQNAFSKVLQTRSVTTKERISNDFLDEDIQSFLTEMVKIYHTRINQRIFPNTISHNYVESPGALLTPILKEIILGLNSPPHISSLSSV